MIAATCFLPSIGLGADYCAVVFQKTRYFDLPEEVQQWLEWEISPTVKGWDQERVVSRIPIAKIAPDSVSIEILSSQDVTGIESALEGTKQIDWYKHPYNQDSSVPNFKLPIKKYGEAYHTASRTIVTRIKGRLVSLKMATDRPMGPTRDFQPGKVKLDADLKYSVARSQAIERIDKKIGFDSELLIQKEIAAVIDQQTKNGYLFRDMSILEDGHYYFPAHQIPYLGKEITTRLNVENTSLFWQKHWAEAVGKLQARLLIRYGIAVRAVNPQNFLIQLDKDFRPTGRLVWRDLAESHLIAPIATQLGLSDFVQRDLDNGGWGVINDAKIDTTNIHWRFNDTIEALTYIQMQEWTRAAAKGYRSTIESELGISIPTDQSLKSYLTDEIKKSDSIIIEKIKTWHRTHSNSQ